MSRRRGFFASGRRVSELRNDAAVWDLFYALPWDIQKLAVKSYHLWRRNPHHPSLRFRRLHGSSDRFTVPVGDHYRTIGIMNGDKITWVWIGTHTEYDRLT